MEKGLASEIFVKGEKNFKSTHPRRLLELIKEKEERVSELLPEMQAKYEAVEEKEEAQGWQSTWREVRSSIDGQEASAPSQ